MAADAINSTSPVTIDTTATDTNSRTPVFTGATGSDVTATDVTTTDVSNDKPITSAADVIINEESTNVVYTRQQKIILCSVLIAEFFCFAANMLPAPFLPKLVSK